MGLVTELTNKLLEVLTFCPLSLLCDYSFLLNDLPFSLLLLKSKAQGFSDIYNNFFPIRAILSILLKVVPSIKWKYYSVTWPGFEPTLFRLSNRAADTENF